MNPENAVEMEMFQEPHTGGVVLKAYVSLRNLISEKSFIDFFLGELASKMAQTFMDRFAEEIIEKVREEVKEKLSREISKKLLPEVLKSIDVAALTNSVLLAAGMEIKHQFAKER